jgi:hypothetical protein
MRLSSQGFLLARVVDYVKHYFVLISSQVMARNHKNPHDVKPWVVEMVHESTRIALRTRFVVCGTF